VDSTLRGLCELQKDIARGYGNIPRSTTRLLSLYN